MNLQSRSLLCLLSFITLQAYAQESDNGSLADTESQFLFINMLEFLGEFETEEGEWINPELLGNDVFADLDSPADEPVVNTSEMSGDDRLLSTQGRDE